jgi:DNA recombination protein RmuC
MEIYIIAVESAVIIGLVVYLFVLKSKNSSLLAQIQYLQNENYSLKEENRLLKEMEKELLIYKERISSFKDTQNLAKEMFEKIAYEVLEKTTKKSENEIEKILEPVEEEIEKFKRKLDEAFYTQNKTFGELFNELRNLKSLNESLSNEANKLANALKNQVKSQGIWGEMILEKVLELSGLRKDIEYKREVSIKDYRPDVVIFLPENKKIIIDAKTSLKHYIEYINTGDERFLKEHIKSIKNHIKTLSSKNYEELIESEFIFMFIPVDNALNLVLQKEPHIYEEAFKNKIILTTPMTLLPALRIIESIWRYEKQNQNIKELLKLVEDMYDKMRLFLEEYEKLGKNINNSKEMYDKSSKRINEIILPKIKKIKDISGIKPKKEI